MASLLTAGIQYHSATQCDSVTARQQCCNFCCIVEQAEVGWQTAHCQCHQPETLLTDLSQLDCSVCEEHMQLQLLHAGPHSVSSLFTETKCALWDKDSATDGVVLHGQV